MKEFLKEQDHEFIKLSYPSLETLDKLCKNKIYYFKLKLTYIRSIQSLLYIL